MVGGYSWEDGSSGIGLGRLTFGFDDYQVRRKPLNGWGATLDLGILDDAESAPFCHNTQLGPVRLGMTNKPKTYDFFYVGDKVRRWHMADAVALALCHCIRLSHGLLLLFPIFLSYLFPRLLLLVAPLAL